MKTRRIVSSIALAAAVSLGATGCGFIVPQATTESYAPSDGIDVNVGGVDVRNAMVVINDEEQIGNVVFTGVNTGSEPIDLGVTFVDPAGATFALAEFVIEPGSTLFGEPKGETEPVYISLPDTIAGSTVTTYFQTSTGDEVEVQVPVLDGTLPEYAALVPTKKDEKKVGKDSETVKVESVEVEEVTVEVQ